MIKESHISAAFAWSPVPGNPEKQLIATGSIAGAMDDNFSADSRLEIRRVNLIDNTTHDMPVVGSTPLHDRIYRVDWSSHSGENGIIAAGFVDGGVSIYSADALLGEQAHVAEQPATKEEGQEEDPFSSLGTEPQKTSAALLCQISTHESGVKALHFNPLQPHFLATGGMDKEMFVWNLQDPSTPLKLPGCNKSTHGAEITDLRWNGKFPHILGTTTSAGVVSVWDLKAKRMALSFQVAQNNPPPATALAWHPEIATYVAVARDDPMPVVQIWDLKKAMAPIRELAVHQQGVLGLSWCQDDPSILVSCGRDGRTIFWNPQTGEVTGELEQQGNWVYDVAWAPRVPAVVCTASFDSKVSLHSAQSVTSKSAPPKWIQRPCCASFGFGGQIVLPSPSVQEGETKRLKIVSSASVIPQEESADTTGKKTVTQRDRAFQQGLRNTQPGTVERKEWVAQQQRSELSSMDSPTAVADETEGAWASIQTATSCVAEKSKVPLLQLLGVDPAVTAKEGEEVPVPFSLEEDAFASTVSRLLVSGNLEGAVDVCLKASRFDDAFALAQLKPELFRRVHEEYVSKRSNQLRFVKYLNAAVTGQFEEVAQEAVRDDIPWKEVLALFATYVPQASYYQACNALGEALAHSKNSIAAANCFVAGGNVNRAAAMWCETYKEDPLFVVHSVTVLEQTTNQGCTLPAFAEALSQTAGLLANEGDFIGAISYASRASQIGNDRAAIVADRLRYQVPSQARTNVRFPFSMQVSIPEATAPEVQMLASQQSGVRTSQQQAAPAQRTQPYQQQQQQQQHPQQQQQPMHTGAPKTMQPQAQYVDPAAMQNRGSPATEGQQTFPGNQQRAPQPTRQAPDQRGYPPQAETPTGQQDRAPPPPQMDRAQHTGAQQQNFPAPGQQPQQQHQQNYSQPPPQMQQPSPVNQQQQQQGPPLHAQKGPSPTDAGGRPPRPSGPPTGYPQPSPTAHGQAPPQQTDPQPRHSTAAPIVAMPRASTGPRPSMSPGPTVQQVSLIAGVDTSNVPAPYKFIVEKITECLSTISDRRRRDMIDKSAAELFARLNDGRVTGPVADLILEYCQAIGTPKAKEVWKKITETHWEAVQAFLNIKFL